MIEFGLTAREFRVRHFEKAPLLRRAALKDRPLAWTDLDELLRKIDPQRPVLQLFNRGPVAEEAYVEEVIELGAHRRRLNKLRFYGQMQSGATLIINRFEDHEATARRLCSEVARYVGLPTTSNAYLSFGGRGTFGKHWDTHDVFAIQLIGRKRWQVFAPTFPLPLSHQKSDSSQVSTGEVVLDCTLEAGDLLYLPRGWWHQTIPLEEGSLHVSVGAYAPTLYDYVMWACSRALAEQESARHAFDASAQDGDGLTHLMQQLRSAVLDTRLRSQFEEEMASRERMQGAFNLGLFLDPTHRGFHAGTRVRLAAYRAPHIVAGTLLVNGIQLRLDPAMQAILGVLAQRSVLDFGSLAAKLSNIPAEVLQNALLKLAGHEVVLIED